MVTIHARGHIDLMRLWVIRGKLNNKLARRVQLDDRINGQHTSLLAGTRAVRNTDSLRRSRRWSTHFLSPLDSCDVRSVSSEVSEARAWRCPAGPLTTPQDARGGAYRRRARHMAGNVWSRHLAPPRQRRWRSFLNSARTSPPYTSRWLPDATGS